MKTATRRSISITAAMAFTVVATFLVGFVASESDAKKSGEEMETRFLDAEGEPKSVDDDGFWETGPVDIGGDTFTHSIYNTNIDGTTEWIEYNLGREWTRFRATVGQPDDTESGLTAIFEIYGDGELLFEDSAELGDQIPVNIGVSEVLRLRLSVTAPEDDFDLHAAFGRALVARPKPKIVSRDLTLRNEGGEVSGRLAANGSKKCRARRPVKIQVDDFGWETVRRTKTDVDGNFSAGAKGLSGRLRAITPQVELGDPVPEIRCLRAKSPVINRS